MKKTTIPVLKELILVGVDGFLKSRERDMQCECVTVLDGVASEGLAEVREEQSSLGSGHSKCKGPVAGLWLPLWEGPQGGSGG